MMEGYLNFMGKMLNIVEPWGHFLHRQGAGMQSPRWQWVADSILSNHNPGRMDLGMLIFTFILQYSNISVFL